MTETKKYIQSIYIDEVRRVLREKRKSVALGIGIYHSIILIQFILILIQLDQTVTNLWSKINIVFILRLYVFYLSPPWESLVQSPMPLPIVIILVALSVTAFLTAFITQDRKTGETITLLSYLGVILTILVTSVILVVIYGLTGDGVRLYWLLSELPRLPLYSILPVLLLHFIGGTLFAFVGASLRGYINRPH